MRTKRTKGRRKNGIYLLLLVILVLCGILRNGKQKSLAQEKELQYQKSALETQILEEQERKESLLDEKAYHQTKQYVEEVAREKLGLVKPEDIILHDSEQ